MPSIAASNAFLQTTQQQNPTTLLSPSGATGNPLNTNEIGSSDIRTIGETRFNNSPTGSVGVRSLLAERMSIEGLHQHNNRLQMMTREPTTAAATANNAAAVVEGALNHSAP